MVSSLASPEHWLSHITSNAKQWKLAQETPTRLQEYHNVDPRLNAMAILDTTMENALESGSDLNTDQKATAYSQALQEFLDLKNRGYVSNIQQANDIKKQLPVSEITKTVPKVFKSKAEQLAEWIKQSGTMAWDEEGRLIIDGKPMENTNIIDLINDALRRRKKFSPEGRDIFAEQLRRRNAPHELVMNEAYWGENDNDISFNTPKQNTFDTPKQNYPQFFATPASSIRGKNHTNIKPAKRTLTSPRVVSGVVNSSLKSTRKQKKPAGAAKLLNWSSDFNL